MKGERTRRDTTKEVILAHLQVSLFTNYKLRAINRESSVIGAKAKPPYVLDIERNMAERKTSHYVWIEAARNFVRFAAETGVGGETGSWYKRWDHFGFLESRDDATDNFPAILALDIRLRKDYVATPPVYIPRKNTKRRKPTTGLKKSSVASPTGDPPCFPLGNPLHFLNPSLAGANEEAVPFERHRRQPSL